MTDQFAMLDVFSTLSEEELQEVNGGRYNMTLGGYTKAVWGGTLVGGATGATGGFFTGGPAGAGVGLFVGSATGAVGAGLNYIYNGLF